nr:MAG TPA: hypothetical protein [Bacteriophage sp.]
MLKFQNVRFLKSPSTGEFLTSYFACARIH